MNQFNSLKQHLVTNKVAVFNHLIDNTFDIPAIRVYSLNRTNSEIKNTRKEGRGTHFRVTCWRQSKDLGAYETYIYWTRASSTFKGQRFSTIPVTTVSKLPPDCKVVFENGYRFGKPITLNFIKRYKMIKLNGNMQYVIPTQDITWIDPDYKERGEFDYESFKPEFIANYAFKHDNHCKAVNIKCCKKGEVVKELHFNSIKDFFEEVLESRGASLYTVKDMIRKERNFTLDGVTFIFDEGWETVEYKIRRKVVVESVTVTTDGKEEVEEIEVQTYENENLVSVNTKDVVFDYYNDDLE